MEKYKILFLLLFLFLFGCSEIVEPPKDFVNYSPFTLSVNETHTFARVDGVDVSITYSGLNSKGWANVSWMSGGGSFEPEHNTGKVAYFNYVISKKNIQFRIIFISIQADKIILQCGGIL